MFKTETIFFLSQIWHSWIISILFTLLISSYFGIYFHFVWGRFFLRSSSNFFHILRISIHAHLKAQANLNLGGGFSELGLGQWHIFTFNIFSSCLHCHPSQSGWRLVLAVRPCLLLVCEIFGRYFHLLCFFLLQIFTFPPISIWVEVGPGCEAPGVWSIENPTGSHKSPFLITMTCNGQKHKNTK